MFQKKFDLIMEKLRINNTELATLLGCSLSKLSRVKSGELSILPFLEKIKDIGINLNWLFTIEEDGTTNIDLNESMFWKPPSNFIASTSIDINVKRNSEFLMLLMENILYFYRINNINQIEKAKILIVNSISSRKKRKFLTVKLNSKYDYSKIYGASAIMNEKEFGSVFIDENDQKIEFVSNGKTYQCENLSNIELVLIELNENFDFN